jgi:hypothetical protein
MNKFNTTQQMLRSLKIAIKIRPMYFAICYDKEHLTFASKDSDCRIALFPMNLAAKIAKKEKWLPIEPAFLTPAQVLLLFNLRSLNNLERINGFTETKNFIVALEQYSSLPVTFHVFKTLKEWKEKKNF